MRPVGGNLRTAPPYAIGAQSELSCLIDEPGQRACIEEGEPGPIEVLTLCCARQQRAPQCLIGNTTNAPWQYPHSQTINPLAKTLTSRATVGNRFVPRQQGCRI